MENLVTYRAEYLWIDGTEPTAEIRSKTKILDGGDEPELLPAQGVAEGDLGQGLGTPGEDTGLGLVVIPEGERLDPDESE